MPTHSKTPSEGAKNKKSGMGYDVVRETKSLSQGLFLLNARINEALTINGVR